MIGIGTGKIQGKTYAWYLGRRFIRRSGGRLRPQRAKNSAQRPYEDGEEPPHGRRPAKTIPAADPYSSTLGNVMSQHAAVRAWPKCAGGRLRWLMHRPHRPVLGFLPTPEAA